MNGRPTGGEKRTPEPPASAPEVVAKPSPEAVLLYLKHAALEPDWTPAYAAEALGIDRATAKQLAGELALVGYTEPVAGKPGTWRNTAAGNLVSGAKPARLTRAKAEELLTDVADRAEAFNLDDARPVRLSKIVAFGGVNTKHDRIQDIDLGVQVEPKLGREPKKSDVQEALKALRARSPSLKTHPLQGWPPRMGSTVWQR
jgi:hypothetical protein